MNEKWLLPLRTQQSCINGTAPIFYQLSNTSKPVANQSVGSNEPAIFRDKPMKDVEYWCSADNCHSHSKMLSEVLRGFTSRTEALEGPEQRHAGTKPRFKRSPLGTVGEGPRGVKGGSWEPSGDAATASSPGRRWRPEGSDAGHLRGGAGSIS